VVAQDRPIDWDVEEARYDEGQSNPFMDYHDARKSDVTEKEEACDHRRDKRESGCHGYVGAVSFKLYHRNPPLEMFFKRVGQGLLCRGRVCSRIRLKSMKKCEPDEETLPVAFEKRYASSTRLPMRDVILIVDDDAKLRKMLADYLAGYEYAVRELPDGMDAAKVIAQVRPSVVVLDVMMPGKDGFEVLTDIRKISKVPVIMLTAKGDPSDRVVGLEMGADDYLPKPFNLRELLARIRAALRRYIPETIFEETLEVGGVSLDLSLQTMTVDSTEYELSTAEFNVLSALMRNPDIPLSRDALLNMGWGEDSIVSDRTVDVHVSRLRTILKKHTGQAKRIKTVWGLGYKFVSK